MEKSLECYVKETTRVQIVAKSLNGRIFVLYSLPDTLDAEVVTEEWGAAGGNVPSRHLLLKAYGALVRQSSRRTLLSIKAVIPS